MAPAPRLRYERHSRGLEFDRVMFFSDAVFAIAMTLLVVGIGIPAVSSAHFSHALDEKWNEIISFFISWIVIGFYWLAHHRFVAQLRAVEPGWMMLNLVYLAAIAFTPFPTALVGRYEDQAIAVVMYAITLGVASFLEATMLIRAQRLGLMPPFLPDVFRFEMAASLLPVLVFAASVPIAFWNSTAALLSWLTIFPLGHLVDRLEARGRRRGDRLTR